jgi:hypothetical protein
MESGLKFQHGVIDIRDGLATITLAGAYVTSTPTTPRR